MVLHMIKSYKCFFSTWAKLVKNTRFSKFSGFKQFLFIVSMNAAYEKSDSFAIEAAGMHKYFLDNIPKLGIFVTFSFHKHKLSFIFKSSEQSIFS